MDDTLYKGVVCFHKDGCRIRNVAKAAWSALRFRFKTGGQARRDDRHTKKAFKEYAKRFTLEGISLFSPFS